MDQPGSSAPLPRIGHAERDRATELLRNAAADGRLDLDELEERVERALTARTQPELDVLLADLMPPRSAVPAPAPQPGQLDAPGRRPDDRLSLSAGTGAVKRRGPWVLPPWIRVSPGLGSVKVDCREAVVVHPVIDVQVVASVGSTTFVVPRGWAANVDRLGSGIGSVRNKLPAVAAQGGATLVLHGTVGAGSVTLRHGSWHDR